ncbi:hypothetical protein BBH99_02905 [Chryseobacterium contaminans]|uniref:MORN repeat variant n=1 Tax=Chryseobacterium contaminans TaxID=1423959 RepID=A0ABX2X1X7_9FLAO|nr:hypothetical protein BBH99_02905 [Chryseobacterium contaminans]
MLPTVDSKFEKFDVEAFKSNAVRGTYFIMTNVCTLRQDKQSKGYLQGEYINSSFFKLNKFFYSDGNIESKGLLFNEGSQVGIWYYFDESGKLVKEENTDEGYGFTPEKVVGYCEKNKIELPKGYHESGFYTQVRKEILNGKKVWVIKYLIPGGDIQRVVLDGQTGKELEKKVVPFVSS